MSSDSSKAVTQELYITSDQYDLVTPGRTIRVGGKSFYVIAWLSYLDETPTGATIKLMLQPCSKKSIHDDYDADLLEATRHYGEAREQALSKYNQRLAALNSAPEIKIDTTQDS